MKDKSRLVGLAVVAGLAGLLLTACGPFGRSGLPPGAGHDGSGSHGSKEASFWITKKWKGCYALDDLQPVRKYMGAKLRSKLMSDGINEGIDAEGEGCNAIFSLATFTYRPGTEWETSTTGDANVWSGLVPWESASRASKNLKKRIQQHKDSDIKLQDIKDGELGGDWDESYYLAGDGDDTYSISAWGRHGAWIVYISMDFLHDPGISNYEYNPKGYPGKSAEDMAVYPFTTEELIDWITNKYMPQTQAAILDKIEKANN